MQFHPLPRVRAFFVLARDQLADQPEREELQADHDEQHPEDQERSLSDRVAVQLEDRQVDEHREADGAEQEPEAEEVQGPVAVAPDEETVSRSRKPRT